MTRSSDVFARLDRMAFDLALGSVRSAFSIVTLAAASAGARSSSPLNLLDQRPGYALVGQLFWGSSTDCVRVRQGLAPRRNAAWPYLVVVRRVETMLLRRLF